jgi:hypothetical protein
MFLSKYSRSFQPKTWIIFLESSVWSIWRKLVWFARSETSSANTIFELSSGFYSVPRLSLWHVRVFTLSYFGISVTLSYPSALRTIHLLIWMNRHRHSSVALFLQFSNFALTSIPAGLRKQLRAASLRISYCKLVIIFPLHVPHFSLVHTQLSTPNFFHEFNTDTPKNHGRISHSLRKWWNFTRHD